MGAGGPDSADFAALMQRGEQLFESDRKGALGAYYQAVTIDPGHIEAWNQIGRLMFELQQYGEAEAVFCRVESLAREQGLDDWAEMAAQNADLTRDTIESLEGPASVSAVASIADPVPEPMVETAPPVADEAIPLPPAPAESAAVEPVVPETVAVVPVAAVAAAVAPVARTSVPQVAMADAPYAPAPVLAADPAPVQPPVAPDPRAGLVPPLSTNLRIDEMQIETIMDRSREAAAAAVAHPPAARAEPPAVAQPAQGLQPPPMGYASQPQQPPHAPVAQGALPPLAQLDNLSAWPGPAAALVSPGPPAQPPQPQQPPAATQPGAAEIVARLAAASATGVPAAGYAAQPAQPVQPVPGRQQLPPAGPAYPPAGQQASPRQGMPAPAMGMPGQHGYAPQGHQQMPMPPFHGQVSPPAPVGGQTPQAVSYPLQVEPRRDHNSPAAQQATDPAAEPAKSRLGKLALAGVGIAAVLGIGGFAAHYLTSGHGGGDVPVIKSDDKIASREVPGSSAAARKEDSLPKPEEVDRDQAYTIGMNHLVNGEYAKGRAYLERADELGNGEASYNLASMYAKGDGVPQDDAKVVAYLQKAVAGGYPPAMTNLGLLYAQGQGVPQDFVKSRELWEKAAAGEHPDAMHNLAVIYATGKGIEQNMPDAIKWYRKAVNAGFVESMANLGLIYANGDGVERDFNEAKRLWEMAAAKGHPVAEQNLAKLNTILADRQPAQPAQPAAAGEAKPVP